MKTIFDAAGVKYWHLDGERAICCGRPLMQQGFNKQAADLRRKITELIASCNATALVTSCPICYHTFKHEYKLTIPVYHHTEFIDKLIKSGKLSVKQSDSTFTFHDPCDLGRGSGIYRQPREVLKAVGRLKKISAEKENSLCCGMNLGNTVLSLEQQTKLRDKSLAVLTEPNPDVVVTACPMCKKAFRHGTEANVKDIAEVVAERLNN
jgi:Fe-S oxidoreductase